MLENKVVDSRGKKKVLLWMKELIRLDIFNQFRKHCEVRRKE